MRIANCPLCARSGIFLRENQLLCPEHGIRYSYYGKLKQYTPLDDLVRCSTCGNTITMRYTEGFQPALRPYCVHCEKFLQMKSMMLSLDWASIGDIIETINHLVYMAIKHKEGTGSRTEEQ